MGEPSAGRSRPPYLRHRRRHLQRLRHGRHRTPPRKVREIPSGPWAWTKRSVPRPTASAHFAAVWDRCPAGKRCSRVAFPDLFAFWRQNLYRQGGPQRAYNHLMRHGAAALLKEALTLPADDRADLTQALLASLGNHVDEHAHNAWKEELDGRIAELDAGMLSTSPSSELRQHLSAYRRERALRRLRDGLTLDWSPPANRDELHRR